MTKALIFDLDNCLAAANEVGEEHFEPAFDAIRKANRGILSDDSLRAALAETWRRPLEWVAAKYGLSQAMLAAGWSVFLTLEATRLISGH
jgi:hypothetical protein